MIFAKIVLGYVENLVVGDDEHNENWLSKNAGGFWVPIPEGVVAGIGFTHDETRDAFIPPQPYASWVLDEDTCLWVAPIAYPAEGDHVWDEQAGDWVEVTNENS